MSASIRSYIARLISSYVREKDLVNLLVKKQLDGFLSYVDKSFMDNWMQVYN